MRTFAAAALIIGWAVAAAAQEHLAEQALRHLAEKPREHTEQETPTSVRSRDDSGLAAFALKSLEENGAGDRAGYAYSSAPSDGGGVGVRFLSFLAIIGGGAIFMCACYLSRGQPLNYGLRCVRALCWASFFTLLWLWVITLGEVTTRSAGTILTELVIIPGVLMGIPLLWMACRESIGEHPLFRRWFCHERGGSARWAGPRTYRQYLFRSFKRRPDRERGYVNHA